MGKGADQVKSTSDVLHRRPLILIHVALTLLWQSRKYSTQRFQNSNLLNFSFSVKWTPCWMIFRTSNNLLKHLKEATRCSVFFFLFIFLFYKEIKFIFWRNNSTLKSLEICLCASLNTITIQCVLQKLHGKKKQKTSSSLSCERRIFTKTGSMKHYVRLVSNNRAVYTNLKEQGILEQCQEHNKCVLWQTWSVTGRACSYFCSSPWVLLDLFSYIVKMAEIWVFWVLISIQESGVLGLQHRRRYDQDALWRDRWLQSHGVHSLRDPVAPVKLSCCKAWAILLTKHRDEYKFRGQHCK